jgi:hypothetical protein
MLAGLVAVALLVPAAAAAPGSNNGKGNGKSNGPPAWVGAGSGGAKANGKPAWAGKPETTGKTAAPGQVKKAENAAQRSDRRAAREGEPVEPATEPKHDNPAWICKFEREQAGEDAFLARYGGEANAFGKCVSTEAHDRDGVTPADEEPPAEPEGVEAPEDTEAPEDAEALAALRAFFAALRGLVI